MSAIGKLTAANARWGETVTLSLVRGASPMLLTSCSSFAAPRTFAIALLATPVAPAFATCDNAPTVDGKALTMLVYC